MHKLITIGVFLLISAISDGQATDYVQEFIQTHDDSWKANTFLLSRNSYPEVTSIALAYKTQTGNFFAPTQTTNYKGGIFHTFSFLRLKKWHLYGGFHYKNSFAKNSRAILSTFNTEASPLFLFQNKSSNSQTINYIFETAASRSIFNETTFLGLKFNYEGGSFYKKTDLRNNQNLLKVETGISLGKKLNRNWTSGIDLLLSWKKTKPSLSSIFQHAYDDESYKHYMNIGFGTIDKKPSYSFSVQTYQPSVILFLDNISPKHLHQLQLKGAFSSSIWENKLISNANLFNKPYKYVQFNFSTNYKYSMQIEKNKLSNFLSIQFSHGNSFWQEDNRMQYAKAFNHKKINTKYTLSYSLQNEIFKHIDTGLQLTHHQLHDQNYGNKVKYKILTTHLNILLAGLPESHLKPLLNIGCEYAKPISKKLQQRASFSNNFMQLIGNSLYDYWTAETLRYSITLDLCISNKRDLHFFATSHYLKNISKNFYNNEHSYNLVVGLRLNYKPTKKP